MIRLLAKCTHWQDERPPHNTDIFSPLAERGSSMQLVLMLDVQPNEGLDKDSIVQPNQLARLRNGRSLMCRHLQTVSRTSWPS